MSRYIESILLRFPLQPFYFDAALTQWLVIDGKKRLLWLLQFIGYGQEEAPISTDKNFQLSGLQFYPQYEGFTFAQLPWHLQRTLLETEIGCYVLASGIDFEVRLSIHDRFQPSKRHFDDLNREQIENVPPLLNPFIQLDLFREILQLNTENTEAVIDNSKIHIYQLVINALVVIKLGYEQYAALNDIDITPKIKILQQSLRRNDLQIFSNALFFAKCLFGNAAFSLRNSESDKIYPALFDVWMWASVNLNQLIMQPINMKKILLSEYQLLLKDLVFIKSVVETPNTQQSIRYRFSAINKIIEQIKNTTKND